MDSYNLGLSAPWRPIHYLGSKLRYLEPIIAAVSEFSGGGMVGDLFSGSGSVSRVLSEQGAVWANDIQEYSRVINAALLLPHELGIAPHEVVAAATSSQFSISVGDALSPLIDLEREALQRAESGDLELLSAFADGLGNDGDDRLGKPLTHFHSTLRMLPDSMQRETAVLRHFGGRYFSVEQAFDLASILAFANKQDETRDVLVAAALSTASDVVNSVGKQFAQPIRLRSKDGKLKTKLAKQVHKNFSASVPKIYANWLKKYVASRGDAKNIVTNADFRAALAAAPPGLSAVYADPPYTREHYSRYYHVLETMCLGDDPSVSKSNLSIGSSRGAYRQDRHQSPFCIISKAPQAFDDLFAGVANLGVPLILSYSPPSITEKSRARVMSIDELRQIGRGHFASFEFRPIVGSKHNRLNRSDLNSQGTEGAEVLLIFS